MKILLCAYACEPNRGSEPGVGWNWALQAAKHHEVWVLTRANNRSVIENELERHPQPRLHFIYHDLPRWARWWKRGNHGVHLYYYLWQLTAIPKLRRARDNFGFDLGHHITMVTYRFPSALAWLDLPFVWGPLAGAEGAPRVFYSIYGVRGSLQHALRDLSNIGSRRDPLVRRTQRRAKTILAVTSETARVLKNATIEPAIGINAGESVFEQPPSTGSPFRLLYVGNLLYLKGLQLALPAIANAIRCGVDCTLAIIGAGDFESALRELVDKLDLGERVKFRGQLPYGCVRDEYRMHDAFLFPSLRDSGGMAVLEAMSAGLPVICLDLGGPGMAVSADTGIAVSAKSPGQVVRDLTDAIVKLASNPERAREMGRNGYERAATVYSWDRKGEFLDKLYRDVARTGEICHAPVEIQ